MESCYLWFILLIIFIIIIIAIWWAMSSNNSCGPHPPVPPPKSYVYTFTNESCEDAELYITRYSCDKQQSRKVLVDTIVKAGDSYVLIKPAYGINIKFINKYNKDFSLKFVDFNDQFDTIFYITNSAAYTVRDLHLSNVASNIKTVNYVNNSSETAYIRVVQDNSFKDINLNAGGSLSFSYVGSDTSQKVVNYVGANNGVTFNYCVSGEVGCTDAASQFILPNNTNVLFEVNKVGDDFVLAVSGNDLVTKTSPTKRFKKL